MATLPPSPFSDSDANTPAPDDAAATCPQTSGVAPADLSCIGEIFRGARKLEAVPDIFDFDPDAITTADHLLYDVLKAMVDPRLLGLPAIPDEDALFDAIEPPPLFLQAANF